MSPLFAPIVLSSGQILTIDLPTGDSIEIDARDLAAVYVSHLDGDGDHVDGLEVTPAPDLGSHPSLSAAERNPNLR